MNRKQKKAHAKKIQQHQAKQKGKPKTPRGVTIGVPTAAAEG